MKPEKIKINKIQPDPDQPRKVFDEEHIKGLSESLKIEGIINPIEVDENGMIITGECRWRAAKLAGWEEVPVITNGRTLSGYQRFRRQMAENLHQSAAGGSSPMNAIDVATGYKKMLDMLGHKWSDADHQPNKGIRELSRELSVSHQTILRYLGLLEEPSYVLDSISKDGIPHSSFEEVKRVPEEYRERVRKAVAEGKIVGKGVIRGFAKLAKMKPEMAEIELLRISQKQNDDANRILNRAVELGLALRNADPDELPSRDKGMIKTQLGSVIGSVRVFIGKLND